MNANTMKRKYLEAVYLTRALEKYEYHLSEGSAILKALIAAYNDNTLPLPSGRVGNAIALALELNDYYAAKKILLNAREYQLNTKEISFDIDGKPLNIKDVYLSSLATFKDETREKSALETEGQYNLFMERVKRTNSANKYLNEMLCNNDKKLTKVKRG